MFDGVPPGGLGMGLEIGGGDGFLASLVAARCRTFVTTDPYAPRLANQAKGSFAANVRRLICDATKLPFPDGAFDFIFSSSVLEHIKDRCPAYGEMKRCLRPGGIILHAMPSRAWKILQMLFYYPHLVIGGLDLACDAIARARAPKLEAKARCTNRWSDERRLTWKIVKDNVFPPPHGEYPNHAAELRGFGIAPWLCEFTGAGFVVHRVLKLPLYSGYGFGLERLRRLGERFGLSSHNAFIASAGDVAPATLGWFDRAPFTIPGPPARAALPSRS